MSPSMLLWWFESLFDPFQLNWTIYSLLSLGPYDDDLNFKYRENTEVKQSCATTLNGEMYIFSGSSYKNNKLSDNYKQVNIQNL